VQDVNAKVQQAINRWQPLEVTERAVQALRAAGIRAINIDLMYGLPHQTEARVVRSVEASWRSVRSASRCSATRTCPG
jgi:oxygen-independent coproporphyrinogen III oxidase